jgi:HEAT repeat protein
MIRFLRNLQINAISFWAGFLAATLFWWLLKLLNPALKKGWQNLKKSFQAARQGLLTDTEQRHRTTTLAYVQSLHLAAPLFSLDEIIIPPKLYAPPPVIDPHGAPPDEDTISLTIPFAPDWPEMASVYGAKSFKLSEALQGGSNISVIGQAGSGKTTTLADLASQICRQTPEIGELKEFIPLFIHAADLVLPVDDSADPLSVIIAAVSLRAKTLTLPRLPEMIRTAFNFEKAILLLDGLDEVTLEAYKTNLNFIQQLLEAYPNTRMVVAAAADYYEGLPQLGIIPIPMLVWGRKGQTAFLAKWHHMWGQFVDDNEDQSERVDPLILNGWLMNLNPAATPLEHTLKVWAAYAGDVRGDKVADAIEAYILRMSVSIPKARPTLELLASQILYTQQSAISEDEVKTWISGKGLSQGDEEIYRVGVTDDSVQPKDITIPRVLPDLTANGLLIKRTKDKIGFIHPIITGYLVGSATKQDDLSRLFAQPVGVIRDLAIFFSSGHLNLSNRVRTMLTQNFGILNSEALVAGRWLQNIHPEAPERATILQKLSMDLQNDDLPVGYRLKATSAIATSGDPGAATLFRHMLKSEKSTVRQLAALGSGFLRDNQAFNDLAHNLGDMPLVGSAICLALVNLGTKPALETAATVLLQGDEFLRRTAAEAFSNHPSEGYPILRDGSTVDDLLVRRAVIYGLHRVRESWATQILEELQIEDAQWVVKDAAAQAVEQLNALDPEIPTPNLPLEELPWLITFASDQGLGINDPASALTMLQRVLREGNQDEKLGALREFQARGLTGLFPFVYHIYYDTNPELIEAAYHTIWHTAALGAEIPAPTQFGLG